MGLFFWVGLVLSSLDAVTPSAQQPPPHQAPCSHCPPPAACQAPSSLFCHPVPLCHPPLPSSLAYTALAAVVPRTITSPVPYLRAPTHTTFSVHLSHQDPHPGHSRAPTGTAKKLEPHFPVTSFPTHLAFTSSEEQQDVWVPLLTPEPHLLPAPSIAFFLADPHLNLDTLEVQGTRGEAELCDQQPWASAGDPTTRQCCLSPLL